MELSLMVNSKTSWLQPREIFVMYKFHFLPFRIVQLLFQNLKLPTMLKNMPTTIKLKNQETSSMLSLKMWLLKQTNKRLKVN